MDHAIIHPPVRPADRRILPAPSSLSSSRPAGARLSWVVLAAAFLLLRTAFQPVAAQPAATLELLQAGSFTDGPSAAAPVDSKKRPYHVVPTDGSSLTVTPAVAGSAGQWTIQKPAAAAVGWAQGGGSADMAVPPGGYLTYTVSPVPTEVAKTSRQNTSLMVGLSARDRDAGFKSIEHGLYTRFNNRVYAYKNGKVKAVFKPGFTYTDRTVFKIQRTAAGDSVRFSLRDDRLAGEPVIYQAATPTGDLFVDFAIFSPGGTINNLTIFGPPGAARASVAQAGTSASDLLLVYPNPTSDGIQLTQPGAVAIYNAQGRQVGERAAYQLRERISVATLPRGLYTVRLTTGATVRTVRFEKQ